MTVLPSLQNSTFPSASQQPYLPSTSAHVSPPLLVLDELLLVLDVLLLDELVDALLLLDELVLDDVLPVEDAPLVLDDALLLLVVAPLPPLPPVPSKTNEG